MYQIVNKQNLNPTVTLMDIKAPYVAAKAEAGQFIILRVDADGERIPLTVAGYDRQNGTVRIIFQIVGATTEKLNHLNVGDSIHDFVGPLGTATKLDGLKKVCIVGGGVGCAIALPIAQDRPDDSDFAAKLRIKIIISKGERQHDKEDFHFPRGTHGAHLVYCGCYCGGQC